MEALSGGLRGVCTYPFFSLPQTPMRFLQLDSWSVFMLSAWSGEPPICLLTPAWFHWPWALRIFGLLPQNPDTNGSGGGASQSS